MEQARQHKVKGPYVVSMSMRTSVRCLHLVGGCWRQPGVGYFKYEDLGPIADASKYKTACASSAGRVVSRAPRVRRKKRRGTNLRRRVLRLLRLRAPLRFGQRRVHPDPRQWWRLHLRGRSFNVVGEFQRVSTLLKFAGKRCPLVARPKSGGLILERWCWYNGSVLKDLLKAHFVWFVIAL